MYAIYKYELDRAGVLEIQGLVKVQSVAEQRGQIVLYAIVDLDRETIGSVNYLVLGTGHPTPDEVFERFQFKGTVNVYDGALMWHVYVKETPAA